MAHNKTSHMPSVAKAVFDDAISSIALSADTDVSPSSVMDFEDNQETYGDLRKLKNTAQQEVKTLREKIQQETKQLKVANERIKYIRKLRVALLERWRKKVVQSTTREEMIHQAVAIAASHKLQRYQSHMKKLMQMFHIAKPEETLEDIMKLDLDQDDIELIRSKPKFHKDVESLTSQLESYFGKDASDAEVSE